MLKSTRPDEESNLKPQFHLNLFIFRTGDSQKDSGLEIEFMLDTGAACLIIDCRAFEEIAQFGQPITVIRSKQLTKIYTGEDIPMLGSTTIAFSFDSDGLNPVELKFWITEAKTPNLLGINFCRQLVSELHFDLPAIELKDSPNTICYGNSCATKPLPYVSRVETIRTDNPICIDAKTTRYTNTLARITDILHPEHHLPPTKLL